MYVHAVCMYLYKCFAIGFFSLLWPLFGTPWANYIVQCGISQKSAATPWSGKNTVVANNLVTAAACQSCAQLCVFISVYCLFKIKMISQLFTLYCTLCMHHKFFIRLFHSGCPSIKPLRFWLHLQIEMGQ